MLWHILCGYGQSHRSRNARVSLSTSRLDEFYGSSSVFSVSSYQLLGWTSLNGPMRVCAHQLPGWVHKSDLEQSQEIHVFASCCVMRLAVGLRM